MPLGGTMPLGGSMRLRFVGTLVATTVAATLFTGCPDRELKPLNPCTVSGVVRNIKVNSVDKVDLLFVVDNSLSMAQEQEILTRQIGAMVTALTDGTVMIGGETITFPPVNSLNVGVVSTDMGTGSATSSCTTNGDNGVLRTVGKNSGMLTELRGNLDPFGMMKSAAQQTADNAYADYLDLGTGAPPGSAGGCSTSYPNYQNFMVGGGVQPEDFGYDVGCVVGALWVRGCNYEQQLEAALKALTPSTDTSISFYGNTRGHGGAGDANAGFVRSDSLLTVIVVTDEDDCSAADTAIYNTSTEFYMGVPRGFRCTAGDTGGFKNDPTKIHAIDRYVSGFQKLRTDNPDLFIFAAITGVKPEWLPAPGSGQATNYDAILMEADMQERQDTSLGAGLYDILPSCNTSVGKAYPPIRIVQTAQALEMAGSGAVIQSICQADYSNALGAIIAKIGDALGAACLPRELNPDSAGYVNCDVVETLPTGQTCAQHADRGRYPYLCTDLTDADMNGFPDCVGIAATADANGRELCRIQQVLPVVGGGTCSSASTTGVGWFYDDCSADVQARCPAPSQRISFSDGSQPLTGSSVRLECLQPVQGTAGQVTLGTPCSMDPTVCNVSVDGFANALTCDATSNTCQAPCTEDAHCIGGYVCDTMGTGYCQNPTCGQ